MKRIIVSVFSLLVSAAVALTMSVCAAAVNENGLSVSKNKLLPGDSFTVTITVPSNVNADTASIKAEFDPNAFEVTSWAPVLSNSVSNYGSDFFIVTSANATRAIDLSKGITLKAEFAVKKTAPAGNYIFRLTDHSLSYVNDNGYDYTELWEPAVTSVSVRVDSSSSSQNNASEDTNSGSNNAGTVTVTSSMSGISNKNIRVSVPKGVFTQNMDIRLSNTNEAAEYASRALDTLGLSKHRCYSFDISIIDLLNKTQIHTIPNGYVDFVFPIPDNLAASGRLFELYHINAGRPELVASTTATENGVRVMKFRASTFSPYMIVDISTEEAAAIAANDDPITIVDDETPIYDDDPAEKEDPIDTDPAGSDDDDESQETVTPAPSGNTTDNGGNSSGSGGNDVEVPNSNTGSQTGNTGSTGTTGNTGNTGTNVRPLNPHTGVAVAVAVPAALVGCAFLSRRISKKRKRAKRYIEP